MIGQQKGIITLNIGSTAKERGLQLLNEAEHPMALNTANHSTALNGSGSSFNKPPSAYYYGLPNGSLEAGPANTDATFIINRLQKLRIV